MACLERLVRRKSRVTRFGRLLREERQTVSALCLGVFVDESDDEVELSCTWKEVSVG